MPNDWHNFWQLGGNWATRIYVRMPNLTLKCECIVLVYPIPMGECEGEIVCVHAIDITSSTKCIILLTFEIILCKRAQNSQNYTK